MENYDSLELGGYYSEKYLKLSGEIKNNRAIGKIYDLVYVPYSVDESEVVRWPIGTDDSNVYKVVLAPLAYSKDAVLTTNYLDDYIVQGKVFSYNVAQSMTGGEALSFTAELPEGNGLNGWFLIPRPVHPTSGYTILTIYEETGYTGGVLVSPICRDLDLDPRPGAATLIYAGATGEVKGTKLPLDQVSGAEATNQNSGGGTGPGGFNSLILGRGKKYLVELTASADCVAGLSVEFAEI